MPPHFPTTNPTNDPRVGGFSDGPIKSVYADSLPPREKYMHGSSVEFFFEDGELAVRGDIVQIGPKNEAFYLKFDRTMGLDYWRSEMAKQQEHRIIVPIDVAANWKNNNLEAILRGPREIRFYTKSRPEITKARLAAVEIISKRASEQRVLLYASEDYPGDVALIIPSSDYNKKISELLVLR